MSDTGFVALHSDMYFTCSSGLTPAKMYPTQHNHATKDKFYYLVKDDTATQQMGDFFCRWTLVLAAAIAAAGIVTGGAALVVLAAVAVAASAAMCGGLAAPFRKWVGYSTFNSYGRKGAYSLTSKCQMVCPIGGVVTYAPGITGTWSAIAYTARNTGWAVLEGAIVGKLGSSGFGAFAGTATPALSTALLNFAALNVAARGIGVADQVVFEGMLRNGKNISETGDEAIKGATMFEQPFINIYERSQSGYYTGGYAKDAEGNDIPDAHNGHGAGALTTDAYYAALSAISMGLLARGAATHENIAKEAIVAAKETIAKAVETGKRFLFERGRVTPRSLNIDLLINNPELMSIFQEALNRLANSRARTNAYKRYIEAKNNNFQGLTRAEIQTLCEEAWSATRSKMTEVAAERGVTLNGEIHHWNYPKYDNPNDVLNPNQLTTPITRDQHQQAHEATTSNPSAIWEGPIDPRHALDPPPYDLPEPPPPPPPRTRR
ncbi:hypothetical protein SAMN05421664_0625 [Chryseobacterium soldanellicola]|uniref:Uncharacterized protein n=1 Tax=Chryseobacterium soldanellicola TaxID=311333 RepID=A0A1H0YBV3_9FLAO|nr:hypothetical protein [Chryseobacterium soldanellicola]SDQ12592.1 hypothetical protein SAMN05421664_0625 [Chryseobacterium soldanellicola]